LYDSLELKEEHPVLKYYQSRVEVSTEQEKYYDRTRLPVFSLFGVLQSRGSGFGDTYSTLYPDDYTHNYWTGIKPATSNYLLGVGVTWNLTSLSRVRQQVIAQESTSKGLQNEYELVDQQIKAQLGTGRSKNEKCCG
jgi:outer membrane protein TolC